MRGWGCGVAALVLVSGCGLDLTGSADAPGANDASADVWVWDATGGAGDATSPGVKDVTTESASIAPDAADSMPELVPDAPDEVATGGLDATGPDATGVDTGAADAIAVDATGVDAAGFDAAGWDAAGTDAATSDAPTTDAARTDAGGSDAGAADAASADSSPSDASPPPDASCAGVFCHGVCTSETDCHACSGATLLCGASHACLADCTTCGTATTECYACDTTRANPVGTCGDPNDGSAYCLVGSYAYHCGCTTTADCPGATQLCAAPASGTAPPNWCYTCGEDIPMATGACKNGKTCNPTTGQCE